MQKFKHIGMHVNNKTSATDYAMEYLSYNYPLQTRDHIMKLKYTIDKVGFHKELKSLGSDEGAYTGWGRFIKGPQSLIDFFNEYLAIEHEDLGGGSAYAVGAYHDGTDYYWDYNSTKEELAKLFDGLIKHAINNTGLYSGFGNKF